MSSPTKKDNRQTNIFDWLKKAEELSRQSENPPNGSLDIDSELRGAVSEDIKHAKDHTGKLLSRYEVAARMSELAGQEITASMLYNWTAEAHDKHRFPCQFLPSFILATGQRRVFEVLSRKSGLFALPGPEALRAEIQRLLETEKQARTERHKREIFLKEIESKGEIASALPRNDKGKEG